MEYEGLYTLDKLDLKNRRVFLRTDYNVPLDENGEIVNDFRIRESLPTIKKIFQMGASQVIIGTHLGRPKGFEKKYALDKVAERLFSLTGRKAEKLHDCINLDDFMPSPKEASLVLLENLRFYDEEKNNDETFAKKLAKLSDVYVNDAFGACHRAHASIHAITKFIPGGIGLLVQKELDAFDKVLFNPERPVTAIIGGSKLETKLPMIANLLEKTDKLLLGGAMIFTFYKAKKFSIGKSMYDKTYIEHARMLLNNSKIVLPVDVVVADDKDKFTNVANMIPNNIPSYMIGLDIGKNSIEQFRGLLHSSKTVIWNGPLGYYENPLFAKATVDLLKFLAEHNEIRTIIGGGDTASIVERLGLTGKFFHVSTGGGASLALLEGKTLIALDELKNNTEEFIKRGV